MGAGSSGVRKCLETGFLWWGHNTLNVQNAIALFTFKGLLLCASQKKLYETILKYLEFSIIYM